MKKTVGLLVRLLLTILLTSALADGYVWYCPVCGTQLDGEYNFCWKDGTPRPVEEAGYDGYDSAADFQREARAVIDRETRLPIIAGGTGLYLKACLGHHIGVFRQSGALRTSKLYCCGFKQILRKLFALLTS